MNVRRIAGAGALIKSNRMPKLKLKSKLTIINQHQNYKMIHIRAFMPGFLK
jgi:hypothetical protein